MKNIFLTILFSVLSLNVFAETTDQPVGFTAMLAVLSQVEAPKDAVGKTFILSTPAGQEKKVLHILPENAAETLPLSQGKYQVKILRAEPFYDMQFFTDTGSVSLNEVEYSWTNGAVLPPEVMSGQKCVNVLTFAVNGNPITQDTLNRYKTSGTPYKFEFNSRILKQSNESEFQFTRLTNETAVVTLTLFKKDGTVYVRSNSNPVATCNSLPAKTETFQWSSWSEFNTCSVTCGGGKQSRTRSCLTENIGIPCEGNAFEEQSCNEQACEEMTPMTQKQKEQLMYHGVSLNITSFSNMTILNPKGVANYEASLSNPFSRAITCDISITSSRGVNRDYQTIDHRAHFGVNVPAGGMTKVSGMINIMKGHGETGLGWADVRGQGSMYRAENCRFSN